jgi:hypothetical protein
MSLLKNVIIDTHTIKCSLKDIIRPDKYNDVMEKLTDVGVRINKLIIRNYQLIRAYLLFCYEQQVTLPQITTNFIKMAFQVLIKKKTAGPPIQGYNLLLFNTLNTFYEQYKDQFNFGEKISGEYLSQIINYESTTIHTSIINNIQQHFCDFLNHRVNLFFKDRINHLNELRKENKYNTKQINDSIKELQKEKQIMKDDLINCENNSNILYRPIIDEYRKSFLPPNIDTSVKYDLYKNPQKYLHYMICLNRRSETEGKKQFQFFPLRTEKVIKYFKLDTKSIVEIFIRENKNKYLSCITTEENKIWREYFNLDS